MKKLKLLLIVLAVLLVCVAAVIVWKNIQYTQAESLYGSLRK